MKKLQNYLNQRNIHYESASWGDNYFNDNFHVDGLLVSFDHYLDPDAYSKCQLFLKNIKRRTSLDCFQIRSGAISSYRILRKRDAEALKEHDLMRSAAIEAFWTERAGERMAG